MEVPSNFPRGLGLGGVLEEIPPARARGVCSVPRVVSPPPFPPGNLFSVRWGDFTVVEGYAFSGFSGLTLVCGFGLGCATSFV